MSWTLNQYYMAIMMKFKKKDEFPWEEFGKACK